MCPPLATRRILISCSRLVALPVLALLGLTACDKLAGDAADKPAEQATPDAKLGTDEAKADAKSEDAGDKKALDTRMKEPPLPSADELSKQRAALQAALNEGRKLVKAKDKCKR